jgi:hypothetical protein
MSHYVNAKTEFLVENKSCLLDALKERFPNATILENVAVRGYRGMTAPTADIVVRFRDPTVEAQGYYDLGFVQDKNAEKYEAVAEFGYRQGGYGICGYEEVLMGCNQAGAKGAMEGLVEPYVKSAVKKQLKGNPNLAGYHMGKITEKETEMNGKKKVVKHIRLSGGSGGQGGWL